jgi:hypothetical protein
MVGDEVPRSLHDRHGSFSAGIIVRSKESCFARSSGRSRAIVDKRLPVARLA